MTRITSEVLLVSQLFFRGRYTVPWHQRYYDWTVEQVTELLVDLKEALDEGRGSYFLGSIMLVAGEDVWEINDGQQRLITLSLLCAAFWPPVREEPGNRRWPRELGPSRPVRSS